MEIDGFEIVRFNRGIDITDEVTSECVEIETSEDARLIAAELIRLADEIEGEE